MALRISFNLGEKDLQHFREVVQQAHTVALDLSEQRIIAAARELLARTERNQLAEFMRARFVTLETLLAMLSDEDWRLPEEERQRVVNALAYFVRPAVAPSPSSAVGFLDDAIMMELVSRDLQHEIHAYREFVRIRDARSKKRRITARGTDNNSYLAAKRDALQTRMRERRKRDLERSGSAMRKVFALFGL